jgi:hypothetical protein
MFINSNRDKQAQKEHAAKIHASTIRFENKMLASASKRVTPNELRFTTNSSAKFAQVDKIFDDEEGNSNEELAQVLIPFRLFVFSHSVHSFSNVYLMVFIWTFMLN